MDAATILASPDYFLCKTFNCRMTRESCARRRKMAQEKDKEGGYNVFAKCLECKQKEEPMDPKKCHVDGCGKKVLAKGMCSTHYFRAREKKGETKAPAPETKPPAAEKKAPEPDKKPDPPKALEPEKKPTKKPVTTKRVNVQFVGEDVKLWEQLKARAKKNRRDVRVEALCIIEQALSPEEPEVYS